MKRFTGAVTEVLTPFSGDGRLDTGLLEAELEFQASEGIHGIFVNGLASETLLMTPEEQIQVARVAARVLGGRVPLMANIVCASTKTAVRQATECEQAGVDAICITQPYMYQYHQDSLVAFFAATAMATSLPAYIYNAPQTANVLSPALVARLACEIPNLVGYKDSTQDLIHLQTLLRLVREERQFDVLAGSDGLILPIMQVGGVGIVSLVSAVFPKLVIDLCEAYFRGDLEEARRLQSKTIRVREILKIGPFLAAYKYAAELVGHPVGRLQAPLVGLADRERLEVENLLLQEGLVKRETA